MLTLTLKMVQLLNIPLIPILVVQGRKVRRETPVLPEAEAKAGVVSSGSGKELKLLVLGDSLAAGVGVAHNDDALAGGLALAISRRWDRPVAWRVVAKNGATTRYAAEQLSRGIVDPATSSGPDIIVVVIGMNDLIRFNRLRAWKRDVLQLATSIRWKAATETRIVFCGIPPIGLFSALPQPLRTVMHFRGRRMDDILEDTVTALGLQYTRLELDGSSIDDNFFALDRFHPSAYGYSTITEHLCHAVE